jgi:two-component system, chemotaxis family, sensor kinase CheA
MIEDKRLLSEYLSESEELLDSLMADLDLLALGTHSKPDVNLINGVFRTVHSLKGLTGMMGLTHVQSLAHQFEEVLDRVRLGKLDLNKETAALILEAGAGLAALVGASARSTPSEEDGAKLRELLTTISARPLRAARAADLELKSLGLSDRDRRLLSEFEIQRIIENLGAGRMLYSLGVQLEAGLLEKRYRALAASLAEIGELIATLPGESSSATSVGFNLLFATRAKEPEVKRILEPHRGRVSRLGASTWRRAGAAIMSAGRKPKESAKEGGTQTRGHTLSALLPAAFAQEALQPLSPSVRVDLSRIDELSSLAHEIAIETHRLSSMADRFLIAAGFGARERFDLRVSARRLEREFLELEERLVELRMVSLAQTFTRAARLAGRLARDLGKLVSVEVVGRETQIDKMIVDRVADPIYHVLRNAIDHGLEVPEERRLAGKTVRGKIKIEAVIEGTRAIIAIEDDGRGINIEQVRQRAHEIGALVDDNELSEEETLRLIFRPGFSTADEVSAVSGRGVGLDAVERAIHELGGEIRVRSEAGKGARFELAVPTTLVMISAFIVRVAEWRYAINVGQIIELVYVEASQVQGRDGRRSVAWRGSAIPLIELGYLLGLGGARILRRHESSTGNGDMTLRETGPVESVTPLRVPVLIIRASDRHAAIAVERFEEQREIIVKSLGSQSRRIKGVVGAVDLEGGDVALVLDLPSLVLLRSLRM